MRTPERLAPLVDVGVIQAVVRPLMSGKEAAVYLVEAGDLLQVAKVYKEANERSFHQRADYTEGRRVRDSRQTRAMGKRSRFGREAVEAAWRTAEVDAIYKLRTANVRVPEPFAFIDGVLIMELIVGGDGLPAPRLADVSLEPDEARAMMGILLREVIKMLCAGVVHGDLSDFNVLISDDGPVIIDFPQWVDPAQNRNGRKLLVRDVDNLTSFLARFAPELAELRFGPEMWAMYEEGKLRPDSKLTGRWRAPQQRVEIGAVVGEIRAVDAEERQRRGESPAPAGGGGGGGGGGSRRAHKRAAAAEKFFEGLEWPGAAPEAKAPAAVLPRSELHPPPRPPERRAQQAPPPQQTRGPAPARPPAPRAPEPRDEPRDDPRDEASGSDGGPRRRRRRRR